MSQRTVYTCDICLADNLKGSDITVVGYSILDAKRHYDLCKSCADLKEILPLDGPTREKIIQESFIRAWAIISSRAQTKVKKS
jgi:hypothetical protein